MSTSGEGRAENSGRNSSQSFRGKAGERVGAKGKHGAPIKHTGLSTGLEPEEKLMSGKNTWGEFGRNEKEKEKKKDRS